MQSSILHHLFNLISTGRVQVPLGPGVTNNQAFLKENVVSTVATAFPNVSKSNIEQFVAGMLDPSKDQVTFKSHMRDFLITIKEFSGEDNEELFLQEKEQQQRAKQQALLQERAAIPGMLTQQEKDEMADL